MRSNSVKTKRGSIASSISGSREANVENDILTMLSRAKGGFFWKNTSGGFFDGKRMRRHTSPFAIKGTSDILGVYQGRLVVLEVKSLKGKPTAEQLAFIKKVESVGGVGSIVNSVEKVRECFLAWFDVFLE